MSDSVPQQAPEAAARFPVAVSLWLAVTAAYCLSALFGDDVDFFLAAGSFWLAALWIAVPAWALVVALRRLSAGHHGRAALAAVIPAIAVAALADGRYIGDVVRFEIERPRLVARLAAARVGEIDGNAEIEIGPPVIAYFPWGGFLTTSYGAIFDDSGDVAKPLPVRLAHWRGRKVPYELACPGAVVAVGGHFYVGHFTC